MLGPIFVRELVTVPRRRGHFPARAAIVGLIAILGITLWQAAIGFGREATLGEAAGFGLLLFQITDPLGTNGAPSVKGSFIDTTDFQTAGPVIQKRMKDEALRERVADVVKKARGELPVAVLTRRLPFRYSGTLPKNENE